jgi:cyclopropane fatty-acyl-phospholipid synthase-like methyltransferase
MHPEQHRPVASSNYSEEYFLNACDGHEEYLSSGGTTMAQRLQAVWRFLSPEPGMRVIDIGCGRGELAVHSGLNGLRAVGIDYAPAGLRIAQSAADHGEYRSERNWIAPSLSLADATKLPFASESFDRAVMSDVVEHLYSEDLEDALEEAHRVLAPGGHLLIHTMPNLWYYRYGYPLFRLVRAVQGVELPKDPRRRFSFSHVHVNEQTPISLRRTLVRSSFSRWRLWLYDYRSYDDYSPPMARLMRLLTSTPLLNLVFCDDLFALAWK